MRHHARPHRIQLNVAHTSQQVGIAINQGRFIPAFPKRPGATIAIVEILHLVTPQHLHGFTQALFVMGGNEQMNMVGH